MKKFELSGKNGIGKFILVDDEDFEKIKQWKWQLSNRVYACRSKWLKPRKLNKQTTVYMHRFILDFPELEVDHINRDKLDNRKCNLRLVSNQQSAFNRKPHKDSKSGYKGVDFHDQKWRKTNWRAQIKINGKNTLIGYFNSSMDAAKAYDKTAKEHFGEYAYLNFP